MSRNYSRRHPQKNSLQTTFKDYFVPIIGGILIILLIWSVFSGNSESDSTTTNSNENQSPYTLSFIDDDTAASVLYSDNNKEKASDGMSLYKGESIIVTEGKLSLTSPDGSIFTLNKIAELGIETDGGYSLSSSDMWVDLKANTDIAMRYANINAKINSILSLTQNEAGSTIYVLQWSAKVENLAKQSVNLVAGEKISISRQNASNSDIDLSSEKGSIDSYFKSSDWFIENNGPTLLQEWVSGLQSESGSGTELSTLGSLVSFSNLSDEMTANSASLTVNGTIEWTWISAISIENIQGSIAWDASFSIANIPLTKKINDLVVKIYDENQNIIEKQVFTVYYPEASSSDSNSSSENSNTNNTWGTTYNVDATQFGFTEPSSNGKYSTPYGEVTIRGYTNSDQVASVQVNGFTLSSFNGSTWRYHAFERFGTLNEGTNQYKVDYIGANGAVLYTDYFTIVKKAAETSSSSSTSSSNSTTETNSSSESNLPSEDDLFSN